MQNIPSINGTDLSRYTEANQDNSVAKKESVDSLFDTLFAKEVSLVNTQIDAAAVVQTPQKPATQAAPEKPPVSAVEKKEVRKEPEASEKNPAEKRMTTEDLDKVRDDLREFGMSEEDIQDIEDRIESDGGMTWGQFVQTVNDKMKDMRIVKLSPEQEQNIKGFFSALGFNEKQSEQLLAKIRKGDFKQVMQQVQKQLDSLPADKVLKLDKQQVEAFVGAMPFNKEVSAKLGKLFTDAMKPADLKNAFAEIGKELQAVAAKDVKLVKSVAQAVLESMPQNAEEHGKSSEGGLGDSFKNALADRKADTSPQKRDGQAVAAEAQRNAQTRQKLAEEFVGHDGQEKNSEQNSWQEFFGKLRNGNEGALANRLTADKTGNAFKAGLMDMTSATKDAASAKSWEKVAAPRVMKQVDDAVFKNLGQGRKQLTLNLRPDELGRLNVLLQVKNNEVKAVIKAETPEAARLISEQLDVLKTSLENKGLKVEKLEVQMGLSGNMNRDQWTGEQGHNQLREQEEQARFKARMRLLRAGGADVARDMNNISQQANLSREGIYIIA